MINWLGPRDVKVRIKALGICGSDVHHFKVIYQPNPNYFKKQKLNCFADQIRMVCFLTGNMVCI